MKYLDTINELGQEEEIISESIHVLGDANEDSIIDANKLLIDGTSHKGSTQFSKYADINTHKGTLRCHEANIHILEYGEIHATTINIDTAIGGSIYAQDVQIKNLFGNVKIYASNSITIESIDSGNNSLSIDYTSIPILLSKIELIQEDIKDLESSLYIAHKNNSSLQQEIEAEILRLKNSKLEIINSTKTAKISIKNPLKGINHIKFKIDDSNTISFETKSIQYTPFYLEFQENKITLRPTQTTIIIDS